MSRNAPTDAERVGLTVACDLCEADPGPWCVRYADIDDEPGTWHWAANLHEDRQRHIRRVQARQRRAARVSAAEVPLGG